MPVLADLMSLRGRKAMITGSSGHLGRVIAETFAEMGADLVLVDRPDQGGEALAAALSGQFGIQADNVECDLESDAARAELIARYTADGAGLSVLVNNAAFVGTSGLEGWVCDFESQTLDTWRRAIEVNLTACFDLVKGLTPALRRGASASVINIGSLYAVLGPDYSLYEGTAMGNPAAYAASKGALVQMTRWLSTTLAPDVRVNSVSPGGIARGQPESFVTKFEARTPLGRMAKEDDFRGTMAYLASDLSGYVTGQNIMVDGGWSAW